MIKDHIDIKDIDEESLDTLDELCIPKERSNDPLFIEGNTLWKQWMRKNLKRYDSIGKLAIQGSKVLGYIQYVPKPKNKVVEIKSMFIKENGDSNNIRKKLLEGTIREFKDPKSFFDSEIAKGLVTYTFSNSNVDGNIEFYKRYGFQKVSKSDMLLFYPLKEEYGTISEPVNIHIDNRDKDKLLVFCNSSSPFCVKEMRELLEIIRELNDSLTLKVNVSFEDSGNLSPLFSVPVFMIINGKVIDFSHLDKKKFVERVKKALVSDESNDMRKLDPSDNLKEPDNLHISHLGKENTDVIEMRIQNNSESAVSHSNMTDLKNYPVQK